jgi:hypothetical protein
MADYVYQSTDSFNTVYYNSGEQSTFGKIYQAKYAPLVEYYTYKRAYDDQYDSVYYMEKDDHYGRYQEFNERYHSNVITKGKPDRRGLKAALITVFMIVIAASALVTLGYLYRRIKSKRLKE